MRLSEKTWPQAEEHIKKKPAILLPIGSTEQHGPTGLIGTDFLTAEAIAHEVGLQTATLVAPALPFGMAEHHMEFSGTISLDARTYIDLLDGLFQSLARQGYQDVFVINGHGGNIAPGTSAICQFKSRFIETRIHWYNWWVLPEVREVEDQFFGDKNGLHATCGEISVTQYTHPNAFKSIDPVELNETPKAQSHRPLHPKEFRELYPDGRMGSLPHLASSDKGQVLFNKAVEVIGKSVKQFTLETNSS